MKKLLNYLSPFAPDQSGACGVFYELGGLTVICDAGGCAGNICGFDEPRWFTEKSAVFSAGLRDMDAIMGRDDKLIEKLKKAHSQLGGDFAVIISTPVPAVIGTDLKALEKMCENRIGIPAIGLNASGTHYYDKGEEEAWFLLFRHFATDKKETVPGRIGIIGATPIETGYSNGEDLMALLKKNSESGIFPEESAKIRKDSAENPKEYVIYSMGTTLEDVKNASSCEKNYVVSVAGLKAAEYLKETFGIPYRVCYPFLPTNIVRSALQVSEKKTLILHSQFAANALRDVMKNPENISCHTWFSFQPEYGKENDGTVSGEDAFLELMEREKYEVIIADEDIKRLLATTSFKGEFIDYPEFAVSGRLHEAE